MRDRDVIDDPQLEGALVNLQVMKMARVLNDPYERFITSLGLSPTDCGRHAKRFLAFQRKRLMGRALANMMAGDPPPSLPNVNPDTAIRIGFVKRLRQWLLYPIEALITHVLVSAPTGRGKSNSLWSWLAQLIEKTALRVIYFDFKDEGRRLLNRYSNVGVLRLDSLHENLLEPVGDPRTYYTTFAHAFSNAYVIRGETTRRLLKILLRMHAGLKPGQDCFCPADLCRCIEAIANESGDAPLMTLHEALESLVESLGRSAFVRRGRPAEDRFRIVVYECHGPPSFLSFHFDMFVHRFLARARESGHTEEPRCILAMDESRFAFGKEFAAAPGSAYVSGPTMLVTQVRSSGGCVFAGTQELSNTVDTLPANAGAYLCLGAQTAAEQRAAGRRLGLPEDRWHELTGNAIGEGWFVSHLHRQAVPVQIPLFDMGRYLSDDEVRARMAPAIAEMDASTVYAPSKEELGVPISYLQLIGEKSEDEELKVESQTVASVLDEHKALLREILRSAGEGLSTRDLYKRAGLNPDKGGRLKRDLLQNDLIRVEKVAGAGRPREVLVVTEEGREFINEVR